MANLDVAVEGMGPDIVLLHSLLSDRSSFAALAKRLASERCVHRVNLPGFGSSPPAIPLAGYADAVAAYCETLGSEKPDIVGNGLGSFVALETAARHGAKIGRLVLLGAAIAFPEAGRKTFAALAEKAENEGMTPIADIAMQRMFPGDFIAAHPDIIAERKAVFLEIDPRVFAAAAHSLSTLDFSAQLTRIKSPTLVVVGEKDSATPPALGRALAEKLPNARFVELPGIGHAPHIHALELLLQKISPFLGLRG
jgi:3-oxoadipate enol-lactonase